MNRFYPKKMLSIEIQNMETLEILSFLGVKLADGEIIAQAKGNKYYIRILDYVVGIFQYTGKERKFFFGCLDEENKFVGSHYELTAIFAYYDIQQKIISNSFSTEWILQPKCIMDPLTVKVKIEETANQDTSLVWERMNLDFFKEILEEDDWDMFECTNDVAIAYKSVYEKMQERKRRLVPQPKVE